MKKKRPDIPKPKFNIKKTSSNQLNDNQDNTKATSSIYIAQKNTRIIKAKINNQYKIKENESNNKNNLRLSAGSTKQNTNSFIDHTFNESKNTVINCLKRTNSLYFKNDNKNNNNKKEGCLTRSLSAKEMIMKPNEYINDLNKTNEINNTLLKNFFQNNKLILSLLENIEKKCKYKREIKLKINDSKGKVIINKQIQSEMKRKYDENLDEIKDQIITLTYKNSDKQEYLMEFMKKILELEIFTNRMSRIKNSGFAKHKNFSVRNFVDFNTKYQHKKNVLCTEIEDLKSKINKIKKENAKKNEHKQNKLKINKIINAYENKCYKKINRIKLLRNNFLSNYDIKNLKVPDEISKIKDDIGKSRIQNNNCAKNPNISIFNESASIDITNNNLDMTKKLETFMDLSSILNNNGNNISNIFDTTHGTIILRNVNFSNINNIKLTKIKKNP